MMSVQRSLAAVLLCLSSRTVLAAPPQLRVDLEPGEVALWDKATTAVDRASTDSNTHLPFLGLAAEVLPWRSLVLDGELRLAKSSSIDTPLVSPARTSVGYWRLGLDAGWRFETPQLGAVRSITALVGYGRERWSSERQSIPGAPNRQITPSFARNELRLRGEAELAAGERVHARAGVALAPLGRVGEDFATNGDAGNAWGFDLDVRAGYDLGRVLGRFGGLEVGLGADFGMRWVGYSGAGTRTNPTRAPVTDVSERFSRLSVMALLTWTLPGGGAGAVAAADEEPSEVAEVVGKELRLKSMIYFNPRSAVVDLARSRRALRAVVQAMRDHPTIKVEVRGHTDNQGVAATNKELSLKRAEAVAAAIAGMGIAKERLSARGFGDSAPIASNDTEEGRAKNRRVEFGIVE